MSNTQLLNTLSDAFNQHDWPRTLQLAAALLPDMPRHPLLRFIAGVAEMERQNMPMALTHLHLACELAPHRVDFAVTFAKALVMVKMTREARAAADRAAALAPADAIALDTLGVIYTQCHAHAEAASAFARAITLEPKQASFRFNHATALVTLGQLDAAETELEACLGMDLHWWKAHLTLANLRKQTPDHNHVTRLKSLLAESHGHIEAQTSLHMALAKELEDCADYAGAFTHYTLGKRAAGTGRGYAIEQDEALFSAITAAFPATPPDVTGYPSSEPIFVIGMPRTGTTLVERIISSHPDVHSAGELMNFGVALKRSTGSRTPLLLDADTITRATDVDWESLGRAYVDSTRPATGHTAHFIDKLPHNFLYVGWIARALPNARIICLRRNPLDTCLSNFRQLFAVQSPYYAYSFDLADTGRYYALFDRLMAHWQHVFPGRIHEVSYEALVTDQETTTRELLAACQLSWHKACLDFEHNTAPVNTASAVQVRQPVYRSSLERWRKYAPYLGSLRELLRQAGIAVPN